ncbi:MAG: hypothetical protein F4024_03275 [Gammaproteobacteria bacterium]|nr:hypothetical protein [Gammaproteobacteria bacterium]
MAARLEAEFGVSSQLIEGGGGVFDVVGDGALLHSKQQSAGQFPEEDKLVAAIKGRGA